MKLNKFFKEIMKPGQEYSEESNDNVDNSLPKGDVIGDTAYSERFVLKILIKFANLDALKEEIEDQSFKEDLCLLWDMTAEKDVVTFLLKHDTLKLFQFALPTIKSERITEIILGIIANMCCVKDVVISLLNMDDFLYLCMEYLKYSDVVILIQILRLINACLYVSQGSYLHKWLEIFKNVDYSNSLCFILENSSNKELLIHSLENLNTICSQCNVEETRMKFFEQFVIKNTISSLNSAFIELTRNYKKTCSRDEFERILVISLQIMLNILGFDASLELYKYNRSDMADIIQYVMNYFENKFVNKRSIDTDLKDIIESTLTAIDVLSLSDDSDLEQFYTQTYRMWRCCSSILQSDSSQTTTVSNSPEEDITLHDLTKELRTILSNIMCKYMQNCIEDNLIKALDKIGEDYNDIMRNCNDETIKRNVYDRTRSYI